METDCAGAWRYCYSAITVSIQTTAHMLRNN